MAVCDTEDEYRDRFVTYLVEHRQGQMAVYAFSAPEVFAEAAKEERFDLVVLGSGFAGIEKEVEEQRIPLLFLRDTMPQKVAEQGDYLKGEVSRKAEVFRFQPMDGILHEIQVLTGQWMVGNTTRDIMTAEMEIIGVYSPVRHEMQMPFATVLAEFLAERRKVLYVNLMGHSGFLELYHLERGYDLGDVILRLRNKRLSQEMFLRSVYQMDRVYYIPPFGNPENLHDFTGKDYKAFLAFLAEQTDFDVVVLDFGDGLGEFAGMLEQCTSVYCPNRTGYFFECQINHFLEYLALEAGEYMRERLQMVNLPFSARQIRGGSDVQKQLSWSEFGDYVRRVLTGGADESVR